MSVHRLVYIPRQVFSLSAFGFIGSATETPASQAALASQADSQDADRRDHAEMNAAQVKQRFKREGRALSDWAKEHGYAPAHVYQVVNGQLKGRYGKSYEIAERLGMNPKK